MHFCTICEIIFLVGCPWKSNVVLEKSLKSPWKMVAIFCMNPGKISGIRTLVLSHWYPSFIDQFKGNVHSGKVGEFWSVVCSTSLHIIIHIIGLVVYGKLIIADSSLYADIWAYCKHFLIYNVKGTHLLTSHL